MKKLIKTIWLFAFVYGVAIAPVWGQQVYGSQLSDREVIPAADLPALLAGQETVEAKLSGQVVEVCQKKGCWMKVDMGNGSTLRVTFKDYGFFMPKDIVGKTVVFEGQAKVEKVPVETLRHYAEDAGKSQEEIAAITSPEEKISFVANGVVVND
ncbi:MAG TPA: DUF4920 domain-containing protein [Flammeovirgaceae bacterium]|nr:DUF4920 domain-containing protein [Flammeovirgaceae bacterium]